MYTDEHLFSIALRHCAGVGDILFTRLVNAVGSAKEVWHAPASQLQKQLRVGQKTIAQIGAAEHVHFAERELNFCEKNQIKILLQHTGDFPHLLKNTEDGPAILYVQGSLPAGRTTLSIVGTRNITTYGKDFLKNLFDVLPSDQIATVSGLAHGVDALAHELSIQYDIPTVAVLAHGLHMLYPAKNRNLAQQIIAKGGALVTEFNSSQKPDREHFIQRNRIIAGLTETTLVVETAFGGGSVSTVTFANNYNREVYALPGKIGDKYSQGCNMLISQHKARIVSTIQDFVSEITPGKKVEQPELFPASMIRRALSAEEDHIYAELKNGPKNLDDLSHATDLPAYRLMPLLLALEMENYVRVSSGRVYSAL